MNCASFFMPDYRAMWEQLETELKECYTEKQKISSMGFKGTVRLGGITETLYKVQTEMVRIKGEHP